MYKENDNQNEDIRQEIEPEYVYLTIPASYVCLYHKLLVYLADFGIDLINDCKSSCTAKNKNVIDCWNMFQSAIACHTQGLEDKAKVFIKYIEAQLELNYKGTEDEVFNGGTILPITPDGHLKAEVSCSNNNIKFEVDPLTGELYQKYLDEQSTTKDFHIKNDNLIVESKNIL